MCTLLVGTRDTSVQIRCEFEPLWSKVTTSQRASSWSGFNKRSIRSSLRVASCCDIIKQLPGCWRSVRFCWAFRATRTCVCNPEGNFTFELCPVLWAKRKKNSLAVRFESLQRPLSELHRSVWFHSGLVESPIVLWFSVVGPTTLVLSAQG